MCLRIASDLSEISCSYTQTVPSDEGQVLSCTARGLSQIEIRRDFLKTFDRLHLMETPIKFTCHDFLLKQVCYMHYPIGVG